MSKTIKALGVLGVVAALGVSMIPMASYATTQSNNDTVNISAIVKPTMTVAVTGSDGASAEKTIEFGEVATNAAHTKSGKITVTSNNLKGYTMVETTVADLTDGTHTIAQGADVETAGETSYWGYKLTADSNNVAAIAEADNATAVKNSYTVLTSDKQVAKRGATANAYVDNYDITVGLALKAEQETGTYNGSITFTATTIE